jgi:cytochrome bd-type quinol oxidase subunit 2
LLALNTRDKVFFDHRWACFMIVALLALRLLTGSSAHLGTEYPSTAAPTSGQRFWFGIDVLFLLIFGFCALRSAYSENLEEFLGWCLALSIFALVGFLTMLRNGKSSKRWWPFVISDVVIFAAFGLAYWSYPGSSDWPNVLGWNLTIWWTLTASFLCTIVEIPWQFWVAGNT